MNLDRFNNMNNEAISYHWDLFIPPENDRKTRGFMFSGSVKRDQWNDLGQEKKNKMYIEGTMRIYIDTVTGQNLENLTITVFLMKVKFLSSLITLALIF